MHIASAPLLVHFDKNIRGILRSDEGLLLMRWASLKSGLTLHWWNLSVKLWSTLLWRNKLWSGESCEKPWDTGNIEAETGIKWRKWNSVYALTTSVKSTYEDSEEQLWTKKFCNCQLVISHCDKMMRSLSCVGSSHSVKYPVNGRTRYIVQAKIVQPKYVDLKRTKAVGTNKAQGTIKICRAWSWFDKNVVIITPITRTKTF